MAVGTGNLSTLQPINTTKPADVDFDCEALIAQIFDEEPIKYETPDVVLPIIDVRPPTAKRLVEVADEDAPDRKSNKPEVHHIDSDNEENLPSPTPKPTPNYHSSASCASSSAVAAPSCRDQFLREALAHQEIELHNLYASQQQSTLVSYQAELLSRDSRLASAESAILQLQTQLQKLSLDRQSAASQEEQMQQELQINLDKLNRHHAMEAEARPLLAQEERLVRSKLQASESHANRTIRNLRQQYELEVERQSHRASMNFVPGSTA